jgi:hypothetical protein
MDKKMKTILYKIFVKDWPRKLISVILAFIIWGLVSHSITTTKTVHNVPIKIINIPPGKSVKGLEDDNFLKKKITLTLTGNKNVLDDISGSDLEVVIDATGKGNEWIVSITPKDLKCLNPDVDVQKSINKVNHPSLVIKLIKLTSQRIAILVMKPIGESPKNYEYLDIYPYHLYTTVKGPYEEVEGIKKKGVKLTFNLNNIKNEDLQKLPSKGDELSFVIPDSWKKLLIPQISSKAFLIDDPNAKNLRINFARKELLKIEKKIPVTLFFSAQNGNRTPKNCLIEKNEFIKEKNGIKVVKIPLFAKGVSREFLELVEGRIQIIIIPSSNNEFLWHAQFIYPHELEDRYVSKIISEKPKSHYLREEYLRNRFRNYMNRFRLYTKEGEKLHLDIKLEGKNVKISKQVDHLESRKIN